MDTYTISKLIKKNYEPHIVNLDLHEKRHEYLSESIVPSDTFVFSGKGAILQTNHGELIDFASMTVNCILGQNDPWVNANMIAYLLSERPSFLTTRLGSDFYYKVAKRLIEVTKMKDAVINHRQCNGTDVTELAVLAAYQHRQEGQSILVSFENSYHGQGLTAYHMSGLQTKHKFFIHESSVIFLEQPTNSESIDNENPLSERDKDILKKLKEISKKVFAVIIEPIQVNNAVNTPSRQFIKQLKEVCIKNKIALIFDEVQTGFGWLGKMTAAERYGTYPNLLAISKALTSGNGPFSALISDKSYKDIPDGTGAKTNGADIRSLVASNAVMDRLLGIAKETIPQTLPDYLAKELEVGLLSQFPMKKKLLEQHLKHLQATTKGIVKAVKGDGLIRGLEINDSKSNLSIEKTKEIQKKLLENGVLVRHSKHTLIFKPPIVITAEQMDRGFEIIKKVLTRYI